MLDVQGREGIPKNLVVIPAVRNKPLTIKVEKRRAGEQSDRRRAGHGGIGLRHSGDYGGDRHVIAALEKVEQDAIEFVWLRFREAEQPEPAVGLLLDLGAVGQLQADLGRFSTIRSDGPGRRRRQY